MARRAGEPLHPADPVGDGLLHAHRQSMQFHRAPADDGRDRLAVSLQADRRRLSARIPDLARCPKICQLHTTFEIIYRKSNQRHLAWRANLPQ